MTLRSIRFALPSIALALLAPLTLSACTLPPVVTTIPQTKGDTWQRIASTADIDRIHNAATSWSMGLAEAKAAGFHDKIRAEGKLLDPDAGQARPAPTPGSYNCRLVRLGKDKDKGPAFQKFKPFFCYIQVENDLFTIVKQTGSQRPAGRLWEDDMPNRLIFLGTLTLGDEEETRAYGEDPTRDIAGIFERIAPFQWRLVIPYPQNGARLDVFELTPVAEQPPE